MLRRGNQTPGKHQRGKPHSRPLTTPDIDEGPKLRKPFFHVSHRTPPKTGSRRKTSPLLTVSVWVIILLAKSRPSPPCSRHLPTCLAKAIALTPFCQAFFRIFVTRFRGETGRRRCGVRRHLVVRQARSGAPWRCRRILAIKNVISRPKERLCARNRHSVYLKMYGLKPPLGPT